MPSTRVCATPDARRAELERLRARIAGEKELALDESDPNAARAAAGRPGLLAYEARIEAVSEWPFDATTAVRFAALVLLATGSWLGGALVERIVGAALN